MSLLFVAFLASTVLVVDFVHAQEDWFSACRSPSTGELSRVAGRDETCVAWGFHEDSIETTGWARLFVQTNENEPEDAQAFAAGFLEGSITAKRMFQAKVNTFAYMFGNSSKPWADVLAFVNANFAWVMDSISQFNQTDSFWWSTGLVYRQLQGLHDGYNQVAPPDEALSFQELYLMNLMGDLDDITRAVHPSSSNWQNQTLEELLTGIWRRTHCSALVRRTSAGEIVMGHTTWGHYATMLREFKFYAIAGSRVHFSGYPGVLVSNDDWFQLGHSGLVVTETTNDVINTTLYTNVSPKSVMTFARAIVSNRLAKSGAEWGKVFSRYNSGTYNNQWMILDYKLTKLIQSPSAAVPANTLWLASQIPGRMYCADVSHVLNEQGFWSSFNRPYFPDAFKRMGYTLYAEKYGEFFFGYNNSCRALLFAREAPTVQSLKDLERVLTLNEWQTDPLSRHMAGFAISARFDLQEGPAPDPLHWFQHGAHGGIDCKVTSTTLMERLACEAQSGPTHATQPVFEWSEEWEEVKHEGQPQAFDFPFVEFDVTALQQNE